MTHTNPPPAMPNLTINQRNLYLYFLNHQKKRIAAPCYVPRLPSQSSRLDQYLTALERLEELELIRIDRRANNYTGWIMLPPGGEVSVRSQGPIPSARDLLWRSGQQQKSVA